jgi:AcrR family transcriptional regulator
MGKGAAMAGGKAGKLKPASGRKSAAGTKGHATREVIKQAMLELVNEQGFTNFRLRDLCERTGLTIGAFYFHFESKEQALEEVAASAAEALFAQISTNIDAQPLKDEFRYTIEDYQRGYSDPGLREQTRMMRSLIPANPVVTETYFRARTAIITKLVTTAAKERKAAGLKTGPERAIIEYLFSGLADYMEMLYFGDDKALKRSAGSDSKVVDTLARLWYDAVMGA